jgi:hypothetical protein
MFCTVLLVWRMCIAHEACQMHALVLFASDSCYMYTVDSTWQQVITQCNYRERRKDGRRHRLLCVMFGPARSAAVSDTQWAGLCCFGHAATNLKSNSVMRLATATVETSSDWSCCHYQPSCITLAVLLPFCITLAPATASFATQLPCPCCGHFMVRRTTLPNA